MAEGGGVGDPSPPPDAVLLLLPDSQQAEVTDEAATTLSRPERRHVFNCYSYLISPKRSRCKIIGIAITTFISKEFYRKLNLIYLKRMVSLVSGSFWH